MNPYASRVLLVLFSLLLVFLTAEMFLRMLPGPVDSLRGLHQTEPGEPWLYSLVPDARIRLPGSPPIQCEINSDGYRGPLAPLAKDPKTSRVLVIGDSVAFGYGVADQDSFPRQLENLGKHREVLNFGVGGYNPYNEAAVLEGKAMRYAPDIVLAQFCINDLNNPSSHFDAQTRSQLGPLPDAAFPDPAERRAPASAPTCWMQPCDCSRVCVAARSRLQSWRHPSSADSLDLAALKPRELPPGASRRWLGDLYAGMAQTATAGDARFAVVVFPYRDQIEGQASARVQRQLQDLGKQRGFEVIDLLPAFKAAGDPDSLFLDAWHPTPAGHAIAARTIEEQLQSRASTPPSAARP